MGTLLKMLVCNRKASWQDGDEMRFSTERGKSYQKTEIKSLLIKYLLWETAPGRGGRRAPSAGVSTGQVVLWNKAGGSPALLTAGILLVHWEPSRCDWHNLRDPVYVDHPLLVRVYEDTQGCHHTRESWSLRCKRKHGLWVANLALLLLRMRSWHIA